MNSVKKCSEPMNSSKNKLNSEIIFIFHFHPNAHLGMEENFKHDKSILSKMD